MTSEKTSLDTELCVICSDTDDVSKLFKFSDTVKGTKCTCRALYHGTCLEQWFMTIKCEVCPICKSTTDGKTFQIKTRALHLEHHCIVDRYFDRIMGAVDRFFDELMNVMKSQRQWAGSLALIGIILTSWIVTLGVLFPYFSFKHIQQEFYTRNYTPVWHNFVSSGAFVCGLIFIMAYFLRGLIPV